MFISTEGNPPARWKFCSKANLSDSTETCPSFLSWGEMDTLNWELPSSAKGPRTVIQAGKRLFTPLSALDHAKLMCVSILPKAGIVAVAGTGWQFQLLTAQMRFSFAFWNDSAGTSVVLQWGWGEIMHSSLHTQGGLSHHPSTLARIMWFWPNVLQLDTNNTSGNDTVS